MGWKWKIKRWAMILTGREAIVREREREFTRAALAEPWFAAKGDETLRLDYPLTRSSLVLDLGGYQGQFASDLYGRFGCKVWIFEPVEEFYRQLNWRFKANDGIRIFNFGLADRATTITLNIDGASTTAYAGQGRAVSAELKAVGAFFAVEGVTEVDLLKINIEGGEYDLLDAMLDQGLAGRVRYFQIQFHDHVPDAELRAGRIRQRLEATHELQWSFPWIWESWRLKGARA